MEQTTQYLYEYKDGKRVRNIGFMKIEKQMDKYQIQIFAKNLDDIQGILFQRENGEKYIGSWNSENLPVEEGPMPQERPILPQVQPTMPQERPMPPQVQPTMPQQPVQVRPLMQEEPVAPPTVPQEQLGTPTMERQEEVDSYIPTSNITYEKIQRQDISRFPRKEWRIANNSFLLHGYHNYHHLLHIEENGKSWLGVPGIFHEKEQIAANAFGFPEFRRLTDADIKLTENEKNTYEDFGYWCRQIPNS